VILSPRATGRIPLRPPAGLPRGEGPLLVRYEDVAQDGRLGLRPLSHAIGAAVWRALLSGDALAARLTEEGILPILSRLLIVAGGGPISVSAACQASGTFALRRALDARGEARLSVDMWAEVDAPMGRTWGPQPERAGERIPIGAVYGEHVLTRPFAPPEARKVGQLPWLSPLADRAWAEPAELEALPDEAQWLGTEQVGTELVFGLGHTDSNQHVNSLAYPALLEEAALRTLAPHGAAVRFADFVELRFRKPFFAGERCRLVLRPYACGEALGAVARFVAPEDDRPGRAHAYARLELVA
jgi:hypothetical protein